jgi:hypothetical protein
MKIEEKHQKSRKYTSINESMKSNKREHRQNKLKAKIGKQFSSFPIQNSPSKKSSKKFLRIYVNEFSLYWLQIQICA